MGASGRRTLDKVTFILQDGSRLVLTRDPKRPNVWIPDNARWLDQSTGGDKKKG